MKINKEKKCVEIWDSHWYKINDNYYPSVTSVLQTINKGYGYDEWLKSVGHNAGIIVKKAQESGSKIHNAIELLLQGNELNPFDFDESEWIKMCNFTNWFNELNISTEFIEIEVFNIDLKIAGTADFIGIINGERWLLDWKSGNNIYATSNMQIAAYIKMWNKEHPDLEIKKGGIVHIGANIRTKKELNNIGIKVEEIDLKKSTDLFLHTLAIYDELFRKQPPLLEYPMTLKIKEREV